MALIRALEFDQTPNKILFEIGEQARQQQLMQMKMEMEEQEKVQEMLNMISPDALSKNQSREVVNAYMPEIINLTKNLNRRGVSVNQARDQISTLLSDITEYTNKDKSIEEGIAAGVKTLDNSIYDVGRIEALARDMAKFNTVNGQKILKSKDEMDPSQDYVSLVIQNMPDLAVDERKATNAFQAAVKAIPEVEKVKDVTYDKSGRRVSEKDVEKLSFLYTRDPKNNIVLKKKDGFVPEETFQFFYNQYKPWIDGNAKRIMSQLGVPESPDATEWFKRSFLTNTLERNASGVVNTSATNVAQPRSGGGGGGGQRTSEKKNDTNDYITRVIDTYNSGSNEDLRDVLYEMKAGNGKFEVQNVGVNSKDKSFVISYNTGQYDEDGNPIMTTKSFDPKSKDFAIDLASFYQKATGSDAKLEKSILTGKKSYKTGGSKSISKAEFMKMSIADRQKFIADGGTYK